MSGRDGRSNRLSASRYQALAAGLAAALLAVTLQPSRAAEPAPVKIAVFEFELVDKSAAGGVIEPDEIDAGHLKDSAEMARRLLTESGRYSVVDTAAAAGELSAAGGIQHCEGCEAALAKELGADQSLGGIVTRLTRMEYTIQLVLRDAKSGEILSNEFTGLRMGANYSWPRGVRSLVKNRILAAQAAQ